MLWVEWTLGTRYSIVLLETKLRWPPDKSLSILTLNTYPPTPFNTNTTSTMANQTSAASRRPKRSGASSAKDSTLGKKVVIDPRVRVQTLKAAREDVDIEDDDNGARPSNISSMSTSSTPVDVSRAGPSDSSSGPRKPNWKRVPLKRSTAHNLLVRPCGPGKIIMPSVPFVFPSMMSMLYVTLHFRRRRPPPKPTNNDEGDTDKETDNPKTESQPSTYLSATQPSATSSATQPDDDAEEDINQPTRPNTPVPGCEDPNKYVYICL